MDEEGSAAALLAQLGAEYEPAVLGIVLEQMHRTVQAVLNEARDAALHAGRDAVTAHDLRLVEELGRHDGYAAPTLPSRDEMLLFAKKCNARPLRRQDASGIRLPPAAHQLAAPRCRFVAKRKAEKAEAGA
ncbi:hypothetical protein M885DRAFT_501855 [Pelagophyceae sp. CCMP2097]|nr:hypothetical protein M885DRAFT_501855 [Pelagophyceae sp. CCMP2097]|mmetsp:Transcript_6885/g.22316  ORF Transcript_6885/g.22316 Transcript_6885/m.22316 type:complete len:131 (-) Transcript_6885:64-456(-)